MVHVALVKVVFLVVKMNARLGAMGVTVLHLGAMRRDWAIPHFVPSVMRSIGLSWPCASWQPRLMERP